MKKSIFISMVLLSILLGNAYGQRKTVKLTFTAVDGTTYVQLDSIRIMNRSYGIDYMHYWPDTAITFDVWPGIQLLYVGYMTPGVGINENHGMNNTFHLFQNIPNPFNNESMITLFTPDKGMVRIMMTDAQGKVIVNADRDLNRGYHTYRFHACQRGLFFLTAWFNGLSQSIKMVVTGSFPGADNLLEYSGSHGEPSLKSAFIESRTIKESGITDSPSTDKSYTFQFASGIPCPGTPTVEYESQVYHTLQILSQCWMKENLNAGTMIQGPVSMSDNGIIEKYCYQNDPDSCIKYGGLYQWDEMMQYSTNQGVRGICPPGWHLPTDEEWKLLEGAADSQYKIGYSTWDSWGYRGFDAGNNLKATRGWNEDGNGNDLYGFSGMASGYRDYIGFFWAGVEGSWWTSTEQDNSSKQRRILNYDRAEVTRSHTEKQAGYSVRCLRD